MIKKYLSFAIVLALVAMAGVLGLDYLKGVRDNAVYATQLAKIKEISKIKKIDDFHQRTDTLRNYINKNSRHDGDEEFYASWRDKTKLAQNFLDYIEKRRITKPPMECATRSALMGAILDSEGYRVRALDVYAPREDNTLMSHALLDVYNPKTKAWETQDPEYNVYWKNVKTGKRASMIEGAIDKNIQPCNKNGCGWNLHTSNDNNTSKLKPFLTFVTAIDRTADERITFYAPKIDPKTVYDYNGKGPYCSVLKKNCKDGFLESNAKNLERVKD